MDTPPPERTLETGLFGGMGFGGGRVLGGVAYTIFATEDFGPVELGVEGNFTALVSRMYGVGALGGLRFGDDFSFRVLAAGGVHYYQHAYADIGSPSAGVSGSAPYLGCRWLLGYRFRMSNPRQRPFLGGLVSLDVDVLRPERSVSHTVQDPTSFTGLSQRTTKYELGQLSLSGLVVVGWEMDFFPY